MQRNYKLSRASKELNENARKHLADVQIPIEAPDAGDTAEETFQRLLASAGGDHKNLRNIYNGGGFFLAVQKGIKDEANVVGDAIEKGEMTKEEGIQRLTDFAAKAPTVTLKGEGAPRKGTSKVRETAKREAQDEMRAKAQERIESLSGRERQVAEKLFAEMFGA